MWLQVEEINKLRGRTLGSISAVTAPAALPASSACDMEFHFAKPSGPATFAVEVNGGTFYLDYTSDGQPAQVGFNASAGGVYGQYLLLLVVFTSPVTQFRLARGSEHAEFANWDSRGKPIGMKDEVTMLPTDTVISMRIFLDTNCGEVYFMGANTQATPFCLWFLGRF